MAEQVIVSDPNVMSGRISLSTLARPRQSYGCIECSPKEYPDMVRSFSVDPGTAPNRGASRGAIERRPRLWSAVVFASGRVLTPRPAPVGCGGGEMPRRAP